MSKKKMVLLVILLSWFVSKAHSTIPLGTERLSLRSPNVDGSSQNFNADISFIIVDLKYRPGSLKILEFGEGHRSGFKGHDRLYGKGKILGSFWDFLAQFKLPFWFITRQPLYKLSSKGKVSFPYWFSYKKFMGLGGHIVRDLEQLKKDRYFIGVSKGYVRSPSISDYKGIIISDFYKAAHLTQKYEYHDKNRCSKCRQIKEFKKEFVDFIFLDEVSCLYAANKKFADLLFLNDSDLEMYRPQCRIYKKKYSPALVAHIKEDLQSDRFVIKPLNSTHGSGVIIVSRNKLDDLLQTLFLRSERLKECNNRTYRHWLSDKNDSFIVETYEFSKVIRVKSKRYDPTMRVACALHYDQGKIYLKFFGAYWKLPKKALDTKGSLNDKLKSCVSRNRRVCSAKVSSYDVVAVKNMLQSILPKLYLKMLHIKYDSS